MTWTPYTFYPHPSPNADYNYYLSFITGFPVFKRVHQKTMQTEYGFRPDGIIWFQTETQIRRFLTV